MDQRRPPLLHPMAWTGTRRALARGRTRQRWQRKLPRLAQARATGLSVAEFMAAVVQMREALSLAPSMLEYGRAMETAPPSMTFFDTAKATAQWKARIRRWAGRTP